MFFDATVRQGPSAGLTLRGFLKLPAIEEGSFDDGAPVVLDDDAAEGIATLAVSGQINGRAINLLIRVAENDLVYGVRTLGASLTTCPTEMGGPLVGPVAGDFGNWGTFLRSRPCTNRNRFGSCDNCKRTASNMYNVGYDSQQVLAACKAAGGC